MSLFGKRGFRGGEYDPQVISFAGFLASCLGVGGLFQLAALVMLVANVIVVVRPIWVAVSDWWRVEQRRERYVSDYACGYCGRNQGEWHKRTCERYKV